MAKFIRTPTELGTRAAMFWPAELLDLEATASVIPLLLKTQDKFISLLILSDKSPESWRAGLDLTNDLPGNLFLKHLMVLADIGGEKLMRLRPHLPSMFPNKTMNYRWNDRRHSYRFRAILDARRLSNPSLGVDGDHLKNAMKLSDSMQDVCMLLLHGAAAEGSEIPDEVSEKCVIGSLLGQKVRLNTFVRQRYIWVSRITGGATANKMGQLAQDFVRDYLTERLPDWKIKRNGTIPGVSQTGGRTDTNFDIVASSPKGKHVAIEVSFQVTTNSTIERKAGQAQERQKVLHKAGAPIAYVIDGAGNFERASALTTICQNSDCTVALTAAELDILVAFLKTLG